MILLGDGMYGGALLIVCVAATLCYQIETNVSCGLDVVLGCLIAIHRLLTSCTMFCRVRTMFCHVRINKSASFIVARLAVCTHHNKQSCDSIAVN